MPDQLDTEALSFMQSRQAQFPSSKPIRNLNVTYGGKRHTNIPKKEWQAKTYKYISDEPERFVQYIEELRGDFTTEEKAKQAIIKKFHDDMSLRNLLDGLQRHGVTEREINALIRTKSVQEWLGYPSLARRLKTSLKTLRKQDKNINVNELQRVLDRLQKNREAKKKLETLKKQRASRADIERVRQTIRRTSAKVTPSELFYETKRGKVKGKEVVGKLSPVKIFSKVVVRYRDAKGRFIKV